MWLNWLDSTELDRWADHRNAQALLPRVIRRLIYGISDDLHRVDFPGGSSVQQRGWDGIVETGGSENVFVPAGVSGWEVSAAKKPEKEAQENFKKRTDYPLGLDRKSTTFVFVTPRRFPSKRDWEQARREEGLWSDVRAYDAENLVSWLEQVPGEAAWFAEQLGRPVTQIRSLEDAWKSFAEMSNPPLSTGLLLAGRHETEQISRERPPSERLREWLSAEPTVLVLQAEGDGEAIGFVWSVISELPENDRAHWSSRALVVREISAWRGIGGRREGLVVIAPSLEGEEAAEIHLAGNHVLIPQSRSVGRRENAIQLRRASRIDFEAALKEMSLSEPEARRLTQASGRSVLALRRAIMPTTAYPGWAESSSVRGLVPALLAGGWDEGYNGDREILETLSGRPYDDLADRLIELAEGTEPPLRRVGAVWRLSAPLDALILLGPFLQDRDLKRFRHVVEEVLGEKDPALELKQSARWLAGIHGKEWKYSAPLREGIAETLGLLGANEAYTDANLSSHPGSLVRGLVARLLENATPARWYSVRPFLPLLAEAAPDEFLDAVESSLGMSPPPIMELFAEDQDHFFASSGHSYLLWALEILAWSPNLLARVSLLLARLAELDPGGRLANRPSGSLRDIFLPWIRHTGADESMRMAALEAIITEYPTVGRRLLLSLLPQPHDWTSSTSRPRWRNWDQANQEPVTPKEYWDFIGHLQKVLLKYLTDAETYWDQLVEHLPNLDREFREKALDHMKGLKKSKAPQEVQHRTWEVLRKVVTRFRQFPDADWALPPDELANFEETLQALTPTDPAVRYGWLFKHWPELPKPSDDYNKVETDVESRRREALSAVMRDGGVGEAIDFAARVENPENVGATLASLLPADLDREWETMARTLGLSDDALRSCGLNFVRARALSENAADWRRRARERMGAEDWSADAIVDFYCGFQPDLILWDEVAGESKGIESAYWRKASFQSLREPKAAERAVRKLLESGRWSHAVGVAYLNRERTSTELLFEVLEGVEGEAVQDDPRPLECTEVLGIIGVLQERVDAGQGRLALVEFLYIELFDRGPRQPQALFRALAEDPVFFTEVYSWIVRRIQGEDIDESSATGRARGAWKLLSYWKGLPGMARDALVDAKVIGEWVDAARARFAELGLEKEGDEQIGEVLATSPIGEDDIWPDVATRIVMERIKSQEILDGMLRGVVNRGGVSRGRGGGQERELERKYRKYAEEAAGRWPRTARLLRAIGDYYASQARFWDRRDELEDLLP